MRRQALLLALASLLGAAAARADNVTTILGSAGDVYTVQQGTYAALFASPPAGEEANPVLALDVTRNGKLTRVLVPGTDGPESEQAPALAFDPVGNRVYLLWQQSNVFDLAGFSGTSGWQDAVTLAGDPASTKSNAQLATSVVRYEKVDDDGNRTWASRTLLHLVWDDAGAAGERLLYTAAVIEGDSVVPGTQALDLRVIAGNAPPLANATSPVGLSKRPLARGGNGGDNVGIAFIDGERGELVTLQMRPIDGDLLCFADKARAVIIETGRANDGLSPAALADKARAVIIETGHKVLNPVVSDFLANSFLGNFGGADPGARLEDAARAAWAKLIGDGINLMQGSLVGLRQTLEVADTQADGTSRALDLRWVSRRTLPVGLPDSGDVRLFLSPKAQEASVAWSASTAVRYRETSTTGWDLQRSLSLGPTLTRDQAFSLVEQQLADQ